MSQLQGSSIIMLCAVMVVAWVSAFAVWATNSRFGDPTNFWVKLYTLLPLPLLVLGALGVFG